MENLQNLVHSGNAKAIAAVAVVLGVLSFAVPAFAVTTPYDPTSDVTTLAGNAATTMGPIIVAVAGAIVGLAILSWGLRAVFRAIRSGGQHV
jgi:type IV secretory pathway VirB2 component (pilin)